MKLKLTSISSPVSNAHSSCYVMAFDLCILHSASFNFCTMLNAHSSTPSLVSTSVTVAQLDFCSMPNAHSSSSSLVSASISAASLELCPMPNAHSSFDDNIYLCILQLNISFSSSIFELFHDHEPGLHQQMMIFVFYFYRIVKECYPNSTMLLLRKKYPQQRPFTLTS
jgi:hypothetical protein